VRRTLPIDPADDGPASKRLRQFLEHTESVVPTGSAELLALYVFATRAGRLIESLSGEVLAKEDLDTTEFGMLFFLWIGGAPFRRRPSELSHSTVLSQSGITRALQRVEAAGLIRKRGDPDDGRAWLIELTAKGVRRIERAVNRLLATLGEHVNAQSALGTDQLAYAVLTLALALEQAPDEPDEPGTPAKPAERARS
jgi:DNA-binding MarR family transcriptional regulator